MISGATAPTAVAVMTLVEDEGVEYLFYALLLMGLFQLLISATQLAKFAGVRHGGVRKWPCHRHWPCSGNDDGRPGPARLPDRKERKALLDDQAFQYAQLGLAPVLGVLDNPVPPVAAAAKGKVRVRRTTAGCTSKQLREIKEKDDAFRAKKKEEMDSRKERSKARTQRAVERRRSEAKQRRARIEKLQQRATAAETERRKLAAQVKKAQKPVARRKPANRGEKRDSVDYRRPSQILQQRNRAKRSRK